MMKVEVGMWIRVKVSGAIFVDKVIDIELNEFGEFLRIRDTNLLITQNCVLKASHSIVNVLELGDYANGYRIYNITNRYVTLYIFGHKVNLPIRDIKSVTTKEQFENIKTVVKNNE